MKLILNIIGSNGRNLLIFGNKVEQSVNSNKYLGKNYYKCLFVLRSENVNLVIINRNEVKYKLIIKWMKDLLIKGIYYSY